MTDGPVDPRWSRLLGLAVHEFRTPMTVVAGYIRMLLKERAGPITDQQRRLLEEAEKGCARLSGLIAEMSELSNLEAGTLTFERRPSGLDTILREAVEALPELPDREVAVELSTGSGEDQISADPTRLRGALAAVLGALRRELVENPRLCVRRGRRDASHWIAVADSERIEEVEAAGPDGLGVFDEWRGGCGLGLATARRVIEAHGGRIWSPSNGIRTAAVIALPRA